MSRSGRRTVAGLGACALALFSGSPLVLAAPQPVTIEVDETIVVSDAPVVLPPVVISFTEGITVSDTVQVVPPVVISFTEGITVSDTAVVLPPAVISFTEGINVSDTRTVLVGGQPPTAVNDAYSVLQDTALSVGAPGVLANDTGSSGTTLSASLVGSPTHGTLTFNSDGSFTYTPGAGFSGTDSFSYRAVNGPLDSNLATVTITVIPAGGGGDPGGGGGPPSPGATPELDSLLLFASGLSGVAGYALLRRRARRL
jgi:hypothetical protein